MTAARSRRRRLILSNFQSPGDVLMLTAAVRDLHANRPGKYLTDVRTSCPALWENNPHLTRLEDNDEDVEHVRCEYPLIHQANRRPVHFLEGFIDFLNERLREQVVLTRFHGDLHLSEAERRRGFTRGSGAFRIPRGRYWIVVAGGKYDFTIKWWHFRRWQSVIDHFRGRIRFVQVGEADHYHPPLQGVTDLRGRTSLRELVRLVYFADGVICPVTLVMHLAAALPLPSEDGRGRACVVVAGGREPPSWEAYPTHQFIHTVGALRCCATGGCWKSRTLPLGDGDEKDGPDHLCSDVVRGMPRCMHLITAEDVVQRVEWYLSSSPGRDS
jgi:ADP-heptose:LPS heptosyltransferase